MPQLLATEVRKLDKHRLDRDLSYLGLARDITRATGFRISERTVYRLLNERAVNLHDRTIHKLRSYLSTHQGEHGAVR